MDDMPVAVIDGTTLRYIESHHLNTPRALIDPARNVAVWRWDLNGSAFGEHAANEDPDGDATLTKFNLYFPGQYLDAETRLHYNYFRDYEPGTGRYVESDPIGLEGGISTYSYVGSNPLKLTDPRGLEALVCCRLLGSAAGWLLRKRHCYFIVDGLSYGLYPESPPRFPTIGAPRTGDPRDKGGECKKCPGTNCKNPERCIKDEHSSYPVGDYQTLGLNSNTYVGDISKTCCGGVPTGLGSAPGLNDSPPMGFGQ